MAFLLMFLGAMTFWTVMWKLLTFVGDLLEYYFSERQQRHARP